MLIGFDNIGNTCYINSCLQVLLSTDELLNIMDESIEDVNNEWITTGRIKMDKEGSNRILVYELYMLYKDVKRGLEGNNGEEVVIMKPTRFVRTVHKVAEMKNMDMFTRVGEQSDISEFFMFVVDSIHMAYSKPNKNPQLMNMNIYNDKISKKCIEMLKSIYEKEYSSVMNLFYGVQITEISVMSTLKKSYVAEQFFVLNLSIPGKNNTYSLYECLNEYVSSEIIMEGEKKKRTTFWMLPKILVICIKRFDYSGRKNMSMVTYPVKDLDMGAYMDRAILYDLKYDLYAVSNHIGGMSSGHYMSYVSSDGKWYYKDDEVVRYIEETNIVSNNAYCLFYRKK